MSKDTILFEIQDQTDFQEAMHQIYSSLQERGYTML